MCLRTTHRSWQSVVERSPPSRMGNGGGAGPRLPSAGRKNMHQQVAVHESSKNEVSRQQEAVRLNQSAASREQVGKELRDENGKLISRCDRMADEAAAKSERAMQERISENQ